jgi:hypothetical protein
MSTRREAEHTGNEGLLKDSLLADCCLGMSGSCKVCLDLEDPATFLPYIPMERLQEAAQKGCRSCQLLLE